MKIESEFRSDSRILKSDSLKFKSLLTFTESKINLFFVGIIELNMGQTYSACHTINTKSNSIKNQKFLLNDRITPEKQNQSFQEEKVKPEPWTALYQQYKAVHA